MKRSTVGEEYDNVSSLSMRCPNNKSQKSNDDVDGDNSSEIASLCDSIVWYENSVTSLEILHDDDDDNMSVASSICQEDILVVTKSLESGRGEVAVDGLSEDPLLEKRFWGGPFELEEHDCFVSENIFDDCDQEIALLEPLHFSASHRHCKQLAMVRHMQMHKLASKNLLASFPDELFLECMSYLDAKSLSTLRQVSKRLQNLASRDEAGWDILCSKLWERKVHIPLRAVQARNESAMKAHQISYVDGTTRNEIDPQELCFDPTTGEGTIWHFRFKESAGSTWTSFDPWHAGNPCRQMVFLRDGNVLERIPDESAELLYRIDHPFHDAPIHLQPNLPNEGGRSVIRMKWRFLQSPMDMPSRPHGAYIRLNVGGRDVPTYIVHRSPTGNWGFVIENCWGIFASFPLPRKDETGRSLPLRPTRMRLRRTSDGGVRWLNVDGIESDSDDDNDGDDDMEIEGEGSTQAGLLLGDRALPTTSRYQWREALLYNYGSTTLPEGEAARAEFDRIFNSFRSPIRTLDRLVR